MSLFSAAHVQSVAKLVEFRAAIAQFRSEGQDALDSLALDVRRATDWLADQRKFWEKAARESHDEVVLAKSELNRRQTVAPGDRVPDTSQQEEDLARAKAKLKYAEEKVERCRRWVGMLERGVEDYSGPVRHLGLRVEIDLPKAGTALERMIQKIEAYLALNPAPQTRAP